MEQGNGKKCIFEVVLGNCQSPILSDQVISDIPHVECIIFNIKFTYLKIVDVTQDF